MHWFVYGKLLRDRSVSLDRGKAESRFMMLWIHKIERKDWKSLAPRSRILRSFPYPSFVIYTYKLQGNDYEDYWSYIDCLIRYYSLEKDAKNGLTIYTRRYRQLLTQVFSPDSILQLIPNAAISLLLKYSIDGAPNERLSSLIPALGMIFINTPHRLYLAGVKKVI